MISEYERQREENIRKNQEILASLNIPKLEIKKKRKSPPKSIPSVVAKKKKQKLEPTRKSSRIIERATGVKKPAVEYVPQFTYKEEKIRPPRIVSKIPFEPTIGVTDEFTKMIT